MARPKTPPSEWREKNTRTIRINITTYKLLERIQHRTGLPFSRLVAYTEPYLKSEFSRYLFIK